MAHGVVYALSIGTKIFDLGWPWTTTMNGQNALCCRKKCVFWGHTAEIWIKTDPHYRRQKCRPMTLVSGNIRCVRIFVGASWRGSQMRVGLSTTAIFDDLSGYFFGNLRDKANKQYYMTIFCPLLACDWLQNEWPRMTLSGYFMTKSVFC